MTEYLITVDRLTVDDKIYSTETFSIMAHSPEEARAIVHNHLELNYEPNFRISGVEER